MLKDFKVPEPTPPKNRNRGRSVKSVFGDAGAKLQASVQPEIQNENGIRKGSLLARSKNSFRKLSIGVLGNTNGSGDGEGEASNTPGESDPEQGHRDGSPEESSGGSEVLAALKRSSEDNEPGKPKKGAGLWKKKTNMMMNANRALKETQETANLIYGARRRSSLVGLEPPKHWTRKLTIGLDSPFRMYWDLSQVCVLAYVAIVVPLRVAFSVNVWGLAFWVEVLVDLYFYIDIAINFFQVSKVEQELEVQFLEDLSQIAMHYIRGWFFLDVLACLPLDYVTKGQEGTLLCSFKPNGCQQDDSDTGGANSSGGALKLLKLLRVFRLLKLMRLTRMVRIMERYQDRLVYWQHVLVVAKVFGVVMLFSHWMGCFYGTVYPWDEDDRFGPHTELTTKWTACFYWAVQTITTVGYGDLTNSSVEGQMLSALGMSVGGVIFSWFMSNIFTLLNPDPAKEKHQETMQYVVTYLRTNCLPIDTAARVLAYFRKNSVLNFDEGKLLSALPFYLRQELFDTLYGHVIRSIPLFVQQEDHFVHELCLSVSPIQVPQYEFVYQGAEHGDSFYIVVDAEISMLKSVNPKQILKRVLIDPAGLEVNTMTTYKSKGAYFGEGVALGFTKRTEFAIAQEGGKLLSLPGDTFRELLKLYPVVREQLLMAYFSRLKTFSTRAVQEQVACEIGITRVLDDRTPGTRGLRRDFKKVLVEIAKEEREKLIEQEEQAKADELTRGAGVTDESIRRKPAPTEVDVLPNSLMAPVGPSKVAAELELDDSLGLHVSRVPPAEGYGLTLEQQIARAEAEKASQAAAIESKQSTADDPQQTITQDTEQVLGWADELRRSQNSLGAVSPSKRPGGGALPSLEGSLERVTSMNGIDALQGSMSGLAGPSLPATPFATNKGLSMATAESSQIQHMMDMMQEMRNEMRAFADMRKELTDEFHQVKRAVATLEQNVQSIKTSRF